jgi:hypothetical protein
MTDTPEDKPNYWATELSKAISLKNYEYVRGHTDAFGSILCFIKAKAFNPPGYDWDVEWLTKELLQLLSSPGKT